MKNFINRWQKLCRAHDECSKCPLGNIMGGGIECNMLYMILNPISDKLEEIQVAIKKWEKEQ